MDRQENLDYAEKWMRDGISVIDPPGFFLSVEVDMSHGKQVIENLLRQGIEVTYTHLFVRVVAMVLSEHPELHQLVSATRKLSPTSVDIGLSISGSMFVSPVLVIRDAAKKSLLDVALEIGEQVPKARAQHEEMLNTIRKWGWVVPFGWMRRSYLRILTKQIWFRRKDVGTFQISSLSSVDQFVPMLFSTSAILGIGRVCNRVVAEDGIARVRPTVILSCCVDHKVWDGVTAAFFLSQMKGLLISRDIESSVMNV